MALRHLLQRRLWTPSLGKRSPQSRQDRKTVQASRSARFRAAISERHRLARFRAAVLELAVIVTSGLLRSPYIYSPTPAVVVPGYSKCAGTISPSTMVGGTYFWPGSATFSVANLTKLIRPISKKISVPTSTHGQGP